ncbi:MAG: hypothetical protein ACM3ZC_09600 [Bacteroidota bacterium]
MDRHLHQDDPICITVHPRADTALQALAGGMPPADFVAQQLTASAWGYASGDHLRLMTRAFTAVVKLIDNPGAAVSLEVEEIERTLPMDLSMAFREGYKITATWVTDANAQGAGTGARTLWSKMRMEYPLAQNDGSIPAASAEEAAASEPASAVPEEILPQKEIDRLIASLTRKDPPQAADGPQAGSSPTFVSDGFNAYTSIPPAEERKRDMEPNPPPSPMEFPAGNDEPLARDAVTSLPEPKLEVSQDFWLQLGNEPVTSSPPYTQAASPAPPATAIQAGDAYTGLVMGHPYVVILFEEQEPFAHACEVLKETSGGTLLAIWREQAIEARLGEKLRRRLESIRTKYRAAAANLEASITRLRQYEQLLPNLDKYRAQLEALSVELEKVTAEMRNLRLKQLLGTHDGQVLSKRVFGVEARRQKALIIMARAGYAVTRRAHCNWRGRARFRRATTRFLRLQRELETCFERLTTLEGEVQRRLEYQADWQAMVKRKVKLQREQEEITRFMKAATLTGQGGPPSNPADVPQWFKAQWESVRSREKLLHTWLNYLNEDNAWSLRTNEEPVVILGDASLLSRPRLSLGAHLVLIGRQHTAWFERVPEDCASWVMLDGNFRNLGSGEGIGTPSDFLAVLLGELAREGGLELEEAKRVLGLVDRDPDNVP